MKNLYSALFISMSLFSLQAQNVGIGTASPATRLHVLSTDAATNTVNVLPVLRLQRPITGGVKWDNVAQFELGSYSTASTASLSRLDLLLNNDGDATPNDHVMTWQGNGNVGIGVTSPASRLHVNAGTLGIGRQDNVDQTPYMQFGLNDGYTQYIGNNILYNSTTDQWNYVATGGYGGLGSLISQFSGAIMFSTASGGTNPIALNERLRIANNGNVGIADADPQTLVSVQSTLERLHIYRPADNSMAIQVSIDNQWAARTTYAGGCCNTLSLQPDVGSVGIGTTAPSQKLDVNGFIALQGKLAFQGNDTWLRLNQTSAFTSGTYTPALLRVDGGIQCGSAAAAPGNGDATIGNDLTIENRTFLGDQGVYFPTGYDLRNATDQGFHDSNLFISYRDQSGTLCEDFIGFQDNEFYFRDSNGGSDNTQPGLNARAFNTYSSKRWKTNIQPLSGSLDLVKKLRGVRYNYIKEMNDGKPSFGFIAEEVYEVLPEIVGINSEIGISGVDYGHVTPVLVEAIKEQQLLIEQLQAENNIHKEANQYLKNDVELLKTELSEIKNTLLLQQLKAAK